MATPVAVGVDNGGTWIRLQGLDARGRCVWSLKKPSPPVEKLPSFLKRHLRRFQGKIPYLAVGSRGVWKQAKRRALRRELQGLARTTVVMSDVEAAWMAAFKSQGIIVIAGTGSIAYGRTADGKRARAGGLGPDKSDEGSGYWIGREWLRRNGRAGVRDNVRKVAALTPYIIQKAQFGNALARGVLEEAQRHLAVLVFQLARKLSWHGPVPLSVSGSVLENEEFKRGFFRALREGHSRFRFTPRKTDPAMAVCSGRRI